MLNFKALLGAVLLLGMQANTLLAHDIWITTQKAGASDFRAAVHYGHPGDIYLPVAAKLYQFDMIDHEGKSSSLLETITPSAPPELTQVSKPISAKPGPQTAIFYASFDNGFWVERTDKLSINTSKENVPNALSSSHNYKFTKFLATPNPDTTGFDKVVGQRLEIVPLVNPFMLKTGQPLKVRVLYAGKPLAGVGVEVGDSMTIRKEEDIPRYKTNQDGVAEVPITKTGLVLVGVDYEVKSAYPQLAELDNMTATLAFSR